MSGRGRGRARGRASKGSGDNVPPPRPGGSVHDDVRPPRPNGDTPQKPSGRARFRNGANRDPARPGSSPESESGAAGAVGGARPKEPQPPSGGNGARPKEPPQQPSGGNGARPKEPQQPSNGNGAGQPREPSGASGGRPREQPGNERERERRIPRPLLRTRPVEHLKTKSGKYGSPIQLRANCYEVNDAPNRLLYQYHVSFAPEVENKKLRIGIVKSIDILRPHSPQFDGCVLFMLHKLEEMETVVTVTTKRDGTNVRVTIKLTRELPPNDPTSLHVKNIIVNKLSRLMDFVQVGRNWYDPANASTLGSYRVEIWPGFIAAVTEYETSLLLCIEPRFKIMRSDTALDALHEVNRKLRAGENFQSNVFRRLVGETVLTKYNNRTYRIDDIDWNLNPRSEFDRFDGTKITFEKYYAEHHNINIRESRQPMLISRPRIRDQRQGQGNICLVPELCHLTNLPQEMLDGDFRLKNAVHGVTRLSPQARHDALQDFRERIANHPLATAEMQKWEVNISREMVSVPGRLMPEEKIRVRNKLLRQENSDWSKAMRGCHLDNSVTLKNWMIVYPGQRDGPDAVKNFLHNLGTVCNPLGITFHNPVSVAVQRTGNHDYLASIRNNFADGLQLVVCVLSSNRGDLYNALKKYLCIQEPVPSQMVLLKTLLNRKGGMSIATKIAIQINCKLGGLCWNAGDCSGVFGNVMVIGIDTYHDSMQAGRSVGAFVASTNHTFTSYYSSTDFQLPGQEYLHGITIMAVSALKAYHQVNGKFPDTIFLYRDGVGDSQIVNILEFEIPQMRQAFAEISNANGMDYRPKLTAIIVKKRINIRFFAPTGPRNAMSNPGPGTVVDTTVTRPEWYDFYLVSQSVNQGTVTPTHYNVILDENKYGPDTIQRLTYRLTHLYYNWPGTIRVPAPCQYAHKLAFLVGQSLHQDPSVYLRNRLFFL